MNTKIIPVESVISKIIIIKDQKVILDSELAKLYSVTTKRLNQQVKRNIKRFPQDFMFQLTEKEYEDLRSQFATSNKKGGRRYSPFVFTEQGVAMLSSVLSSEKAIEVNILIIRAFIKLREILSTHNEVKKKLEEMENKYNAHEEKIIQIIHLINHLLEPPEKPKRKIGFSLED